MREEDQPDPVPLCVDLDGTVLRTDLFQDSLARYLGPNPLRLLSVLWWYLRGGRPLAKKILHARQAVPQEGLPVWDSMIAYLREEKAAGRKLILATAADEETARALVAPLGLFEEILGTKDGFNLLGHQKRDRLVQLYGEKGFDYVGDSSADLRVWPHARVAIVAHRPAWFANKVRLLCDKVVCIGEPAPSVDPWMHYFGGRSFRRAAPVWAVPIAAMMAGAPIPFGLLVVITVAFWIGAAAHRIFDDVLDLAEDRDHTERSIRPLPSLRISVIKALAMTLFLGVLSIAFAALGGIKVLASLGVFHLLCLAYGTRGWLSPAARFVARLLIPATGAASGYFAAGAPVLGSAFWGVASALAFGPVVFDIWRQSKTRDRGT
jgi:hypothetical protein